MTMSSVMEHILDLARWAPSGDNTQPWRFEIRSERHLVIHGFAQGPGWRCEIRRRVDLPARADSTKASTRSTFCSVPAKCSR